MGRYFVKPEIYMGAESLGEIIKDIRSAFVVTDPFMKKSGMIEYVTKVLDGLAIRYRMFAEVLPDPDIAVVSRGMAMMTEAKPQAIIAMGGGSAIDAAKAMKYLLASQGQCCECRFVAIPTTSGTGTEVSRFSVISDPKKAAKYPLISDELLPDAAILDVQLTLSVPAQITADTGMDVLTHAVEAYVSVDADDFTDAAAEKAIRLVRENLLKAYREPEDCEARRKMHHASCLAGMAFSNAGLGLNHGMAHALGGRFHIPHGRANAVLLPYVTEYNSGCRKELTSAAVRYGAIAELLGIDAADLRQSIFNVIRMMKRMSEQMGIPDRICKLGISREDFTEALDELVKGVLEDACKAANPVKCTAQDVRRLFLEAY